MNTYYMATWHTQLKGRARSRCEKAIHAIDPVADLVCVDIPGNQVRMWLERPDDGTNNNADVVQRRKLCVELVDAELAKVAK